MILRIYVKRILACVINGKYNRVDMAKKLHYQF